MATAERRLLAEKYGRRIDGKKLVAHVQTIGETEEVAYVCQRRLAFVYVVQMGVRIFEVRSWTIKLQ